MKNVVCIAHNVHNLAKTIQNNAVKLNNLIVQIKKCYNFKHKYKKDLKLKYNVTMHKFPIKTRWGSWLSFAEFLHTNYQNFKQHIESLKSNKYT